MSLKAEELPVSLPNIPNEDGMCFQVPGKSWQFDSVAAYVTLLLITVACALDSW